MNKRNILLITFLIIIISFVCFLVFRMDAFSTESDFGDEKHGLYICADGYEAKDLNDCKKNH